MACSLCESNYGISLCDCTYLMCDECINNLEFPNCPQCRRILNIKLFIAGKITTSHPNQYARRFVLKSEYEDFGMIKNNLRAENCGNITIKDEDIIDYDDFINVEQELPIQQITPTTALTGPFVIVDDNCIPQHSFWQSNDYVDVKSISDIVNKRNHQAIDNCDVFVLKLNIMYDCFRSIAEWGIASALGKTLIILFPNEDELEKEYNNIDTSDLKNLLKEHEYNIMEKIGQKKEEKYEDEKRDLVIRFIKNKSDKMKSEFYMFAAESIKTLDKLSFTKKEAIFTSHPIFNFTYNEYVKNLQNIISKKN